MWLHSGIHFHAPPPTPRYLFILFTWNPEPLNWPCVASWWLFTTLRVAENVQPGAVHGTCDCRCACRAPSEVNSFSHGSHDSTTPAPVPPCDAGLVEDDGASSSLAVPPASVCASSLTKPTPPSTLFIALFGFPAAIPPAVGGEAPRGLLVPCIIPLPPPAATATTRGPPWLLPSRIPPGLIAGCQVPLLPWCNPATRGTSSAIGRGGPKGGTPPWAMLCC